MTVIAGLLPVFFALAVGYASGRTGLIDNKHISALNTLVMSIALPIALFTILASATREDIISHGAVAGAGLAVMGSTFVVTFFLQKHVWRQTSPSAAVQALTVAFPNVAAVGLPLADSVLGSTGRLAVAVTLAVGTLTISPVSIALIKRGTPAPGPGQHPRPGFTVTFLKALLTPAVVAPILGISWSLSGLPFPPLLDSTLSEVGGITAGLALFVTGLVLSSQHLTPSANVVVSVIIGDVVRPALALLLVTLFSIPGPMSSELLILMAVPSGFFGVLVALNYKLDIRVSGATLFYSTLLSIGTLAVVILFLPAL